MMKKLIFILLFIVTTITTYSQTFPRLAQNGESFGVIRLKWNDNFEDVADSILALRTLANLNRTIMNDSLTGIRSDFNLFFSPTLTRTKFVADTFAFSATTFARYATNHIYLTSGGSSFDFNFTGSVPSLTLRNFILTPGTEPALSKGLIYYDVTDDQYYGYNGSKIPLGLQLNQTLSPDSILFDVNYITLTPTNKLKLGSKTYGTYAFKYNFQTGAIDSIYSIQFTNSTSGNDALLGFRDDTTTAITPTDDNNIAPSWNGVKEWTKMMLYPLNIGSTSITQVASEDSILLYNSGQNNTTFINQYANSTIIGYKWGTGISNRSAISFFDDNSIYISPYANTAVFYNDSTVALCENRFRSDVRLDKFMAVDTAFALLINGVFDTASISPPSGWALKCKLPSLRKYMKDTIDGELNWPRYNGDPYYKVNAVDFTKQITAAIEYDRRWILQDRNKINILFIICILNTLVIISLILYIFKIKK